MAAIIVASLLCLPSDTGQISAVDARPAAAAVAATTTITAIAAATITSSDDVEEEVEVSTASMTTAMATTRKTSAAQFSVNMILPFSKSTIRYSYTEPSGSVTSARTPARTEDVDQAHSMSVSPYGCGTAADGDDVGCPRKRKRTRWKTSTAEAAAQTNTVMPLPGYPTTDGGRGVVFEAAAEQLDRLYTVSRVDAAVSSSADDGEASGGEGGATDSSAEDVTAT